MPELRPPETCANCGAELPRQAKSCPECGADERTGWRENSVYDGLDLPETAWTDSAGEVPESQSRKTINGLPWYWWIVGAGLTLLLGLGSLALLN